MREIFRRKKVGERLSVRQVNKLSSISRRIVSSATGSYKAGVSNDRFIADSNPPPFIEMPVIITASLGDDIYEVQSRYYDTNVSSWLTDVEFGPFDLDASDLNISLSVDNVITAFWHEQRAMFIPSSSSSADCLPLVDYQGGNHAVARDPTLFGAPEIHFGLEQSNNGETDWKLINDRFYIVNEISDATNVGIYTFSFSSPFRFLRVSAVSSVPSFLEWAALRIEAKCKEGVPHSLGLKLENSGPVLHWKPEASIRNDPANVDIPSFSVLPNGHVIQVKTPELQTWTYKADVACRFGTPVGEICDICQPNTSPLNIKVVYTGVTNSICNECVDINGREFILTQNDAEPCEWTYTDEILCDFLRLRLFLNDFGSGPFWDLRVENAVGNVASHTGVAVGLGNLMDCSLQEILSHSTDGQSLCFWSSSTVTITPQ